MIAKRKLIVLAAISLVASTTALGGFSVAWFSATRRHTVNFQAVQVATPGINVTEFKCYGVSQLTKGPTTTSFTFVNQEVVEMPRYDPSNITYSLYLRAIVVHIIFDNTATSSATLSTITLNDTFSTGTLGTGDYDDNFTSNAFQITLSPGTTLTSGWTQASLSYTNADTKSFVTFNPNPTKSTSLTMKTITPGESEAWFVLEYSANAMLYIENDRYNNERVVIYHDDIIYRIS